MPSPSPLFSTTQRVVRIASLLPLLCPLPYLSAQSETSAVEEPVVMLEAFKVSGDRLAASDQETPDHLNRYDAQQIDDTGAFSMSDFLETLPGANSSEEVLVLIDGEPAYIDPSTLPLGMVEGVDVARDGSMPEFGAQSSGRVINIRLKKNYQGGEAGAKIDGSFAGGGAQQTVRLSSSAVRGKLRTLFALNASRREELLATDRDFSRDQNHTAWGGSDLRLAWGSPAVVRSISGNLNGVTDANGNPVTTALVPEGQHGANLATSDFLPGGTEAASLRRFDTARYRQLVSPSRQIGATFDVSYPIFGERLRVSLSGSVSHNEGDRIGAPPVTPASAQTLVPAAYNPFGQDIEVGLVHTEFGPTRQESSSDRGQLGLKFNGRISRNWSWNGGIAYRRDESSQSATDLNPLAFSAALASPDPATRFNPFGDPAAGPINAHLYPALTFLRTSDTTRNNTRVDLATNGTVVESWAGPVSMSVQGGFQVDSRTRNSSGAPGASTPLSHYESEARNVSTSFNIPLTSRRNALPLLNRLETRVSARYSTQDDGSEGTGNDLGLVWSPVRPLLLRARYSTQSTVASPDVSDRRETLVSETLLDPRRDLAATEIQVIVRDLAHFEPEKSTRRTLGFTLEPPFVKNLRLSAVYQTRERHDLIQRRFDPQDVVNNEAAFPNRITRTAQTAEDISLGHPGAITVVDITPGNTGRSQDDSLDLDLEYNVNTKRLGRFRFSGTAEHDLGSIHEIAPGIAFINDGGGRSSRPEWKFQGLTSWNFKAWMTSVRVDYTGEIEPTLRGEGIPAQTLVTLNTGWRFRRPLGPKRFVQYRLGFGIGNLFDAAPARADTISGYRGGSPLGRTYSLSLSATI
ncbi:MAG: TonB-dependent receptor [Nibricoccus sp.]